MESRVAEIKQTLEVLENLAPLADAAADKKIDQLIDALNEELRELTFDGGE